jgi:hypothetical protein
MTDFSDIIARANVITEVDSKTLSLMLNVQSLTVVATPINLNEYITGNVNNDDPVYLIDEVQVAFIQDPADSLNTTMGLIDQILPILIRDIGEDLLGVPDATVLMPEKRHQDYLFVEDRQARYIDRQTEERVAVADVAVANLHRGVEVIFHILEDDMVVEATKGAADELVQHHLMMVDMDAYLSTRLGFGHPVAKATRKPVFSHIVVEDYKVCCIGKRPDDRIFIEHLLVFVAEKGVSTPLPMPSAVGKETVKGPFEDHSELTDVTPKEVCPSYVDSTYTDHEVSFVGHREAVVELPMGSYAALEVNQSVNDVLNAYDDLTMQFDSDLAGATDKKLKSRVSVVDQDPKMVAPLYPDSIELGSTKSVISVKPVFSEVSFSCATSNEITQSVNDVVNAYDDLTMQFSDDLGSAADKKLRDLFDVADSGAKRTHKPRWDSTTLYDLAYSWGSIEARSALGFGHTLGVAVHQHLSDLMQMPDTLTFSLGDEGEYATDKRIRDSYSLTDIGVKLIAPFKDDPVGFHQEISSIDLVEWEDRYGHQCDLRAETDKPLREDIVRFSDKMVHAFRRDQEAHLDLTAIDLSIKEIEKPRFEEIHHTHLLQYGMEHFEWHGVSLKEEFGMDASLWEKDAVSFDHQVLVKRIVSLPRMDNIGVPDTVVMLLSTEVPYEHVGVRDAHDVVTDTPRNDAVSVTDGTTYALTKGLDDPLTLTVSVNLIKVRPLVLNDHLPLPDRVGAELGGVPQESHPADDTTPVYDSAAAQPQVELLSDLEFTDETIFGGDKGVDDPLGFGSQVHVLSVTDYKIEDEVTFKHGVGFDRHTEISDKELTSVTDAVQVMPIRPVFSDLQFDDGYLFSPVKGVEDILSLSDRVRVLNFRQAELQETFGFHHGVSGGPWINPKWTGSDTNDPAPVEDAAAQFIHKPVFDSIELSDAILGGRQGPGHADSIGLIEEVSVRFRRDLQLEETLPLSDDVKKDWELSDDSPEWAQDAATLRNALANFTDKPAGHDWVYPRDQHSHRIEKEIEDSVRIGDIVRPTGVRNVSLFDQFGFSHALRRDLQQQLRDEISYLSELDDSGKYDKKFELDDILGSLDSVGSDTTVHIQSVLDLLDSVRTSGDRARDPVDIEVLKDTAGKELRRLVGDQISFDEVIGYIREVQLSVEDGVSLTDHALPQLIRGLETVLGLHESLTTQVIATTGDATKDNVATVDAAHARIDAVMGSELPMPMKFKYAYVVDLEIVDLLALSDGVRSGIERNQAERISLATAIFAAAEVELRADAVIEDRFFSNMCNLQDRILLGDETSMVDQDSVMDSDAADDEVLFADDTRIQKIPVYRQQDEITHSHTVSKGGNKGAADGLAFSQDLAFFRDRGVIERVTLQDLVGHEVSTPAESLVSLASEIEIQVIRKRVLILEEGLSAQDKIQITKVMISSDGTVTEVDVTDGDVVMETGRAIGDMTFNETTFN